MSHTPILYIVCTAKLQFTPKLCVNNTVHRTLHTVRKYWQLGNVRRKRLNYTSCQCCLRSRCRKRHTYIRTYIYLLGEMSTKLSYCRLHANIGREPCDIYIYILPTLHYMNSMLNTRVYPTHIIEFVLKEWDWCRTNSDSSMWFSVFTHVYFISNKYFYFIEYAMWCDVMSYTLFLK